MSRFIPLPLVLLALTLFGTVGGAEKKPLQGLELEDPPAPFVPKNPPTEADRYRQQALSYYAAGLMYDQQGDREEALRHYQRALRYDPTSSAVLQQIVEAAWALERHQEAIRYALKAAEVAPSNPELLERLGAFLIEQNDIDRAVDLYEKALALQKDKAKTAGYIRLKMLVGQLYAQLEKYEPAADAMAVVFEALQHPDDYELRGRIKQTLEGEKGRGYALLGDTFLRVDRLNEAEAAFAASHKLSGDDTLYAFYEAQVLEKRKQPAEALARLEKYFDAESEDAGTAPYDLLKRLYVAEKRAQDFAPKLEALAKDDPKNVPLRYALAKEYRESKQYAKAKPVFDDLLRRRPTIDAYLGLMASALHTKDYARIVDALAEVTAKEGDLESVDEFVKELIADPSNIDAFTEAARKAAHDAEPEDGKPVAYAAAQVLLTAKKYDLAGEFFELALLHEPKNLAAIYLKWGAGLLGDEQNEAAVKIFQRAVDEEASPDEPVFQAYLALSLEFAGRTEDALSMIRKAIDLGEDDLRYAMRQPWILFHAKRYREAAESYDELLEEFDDKSKTDAERSMIREARLAQSNVYVMLNQFDKAERPLELILDEFPDDIGAMNDLGYLWADRNKNLELALDMTRKAVADDPENRAYRDSLGWVYYRLGRFGDAIAELEKAISPDPSDPEDEPDGVILDHLADAYAAAGRNDDARKTWQRAEKAFDKEGDAEKLASVRKKLAK